MKKRSFIISAVFLSLVSLNVASAEEVTLLSQDNAVLVSPDITTDRLSPAAPIEPAEATEKAKSPNFFKNIWVKTQEKSEAADQAKPFNPALDVADPEKREVLQREADENPTEESAPVEAPAEVKFDLKGGIEKIIETPKVELAKEWWDGDYATGNWFGFRDQLINHGVTLDSSFLQSSFGKGHGGVNDARAVRGYGLWNLSATFDTEKMGLWKGGTGYLLYQLKKGMGLSSEYMGDFQVLDGWDFRQMNQLSEAWYQQKLFNDKVRLKFGKQDANVDFCALTKGFDFINTSFSIMPTTPLPCYPDQKFGFMAEINPKEWLSLRNGVYHKNGGAFNVSEVEIRPNIKNLPGRYFTGYWFHSDGVEAIDSIDINGDPVTRNFFSNHGWYAAFEQMVYKEKKNDKEDEQGLTLLGQVGLTPSNRNDVNRYFGAALHYKGPIPKRDDDIMGVGMAMANFSTRLTDIDGRGGQETALEVFYRIQINKWFYLQPDFQYIMNPSGNAPNSIAIGLRSVIKF